MSSPYAVGTVEEESALRTFLGMLRRRLPIFVVALVLVPAAALAFSLRTEKQYTATAELLFRDPGFDQKLFGSSVLSPSRDPEREAATNAKLVSLEVISARALQALDRRLTVSQLRDKVEVAPEGEADVVAVKARDTNPRAAATLANTVAEQYIVFRRQADRAKIADAISVVRKQRQSLDPAERAGSEGRAVNEQIGQLQILASLQTGNAELIQPAKRPESPSSPKPVRATILGLFAGLLLGVGVAGLMDRLDRRLRTKREAEALIGRPVLGTVPESPALRKAGTPLHLVGAEGEAFRAIRTNLRYFAIDQDVKSLLITSSAPGDGKSTTARHLAATAATSNIKVVLVEADLRRPVLEELSDRLRGGQGLTNVLTGQTAIANVIQQLPLSMEGDAEDGLALDVVTAGPVPPNPTDLLESQRMRDVLAELESRYELVILDTSPPTIVPDPIALMGVVSGVVIVIRVGKSTKTGVRELRAQLDHLEISPLGVIMNGASSQDSPAYYGYYHYGPPNAPTTESNEAGSPDRSRWSGPGKREKAAR